MFITLVLCLDCGLCRAYFNLPLHPLCKLVILKSNTSISFVFLTVSSLTWVLVITLITLTSAK